MTRVLVLWTRPQHLSAREADAWLRAEAARLSAVAEVERLTLTRLGPLTAPQACPGDWLCEVRLRDGADGDACLRHGEWADWLRDLRLLGMRPTAAVALTTTVL